MDNSRELKQKVLLKLLPASVIKETRCFVLYDNHPMDERQLDITICTKYDLKEYYQRELRSSKPISNGFKIKIFRNLKCELYYLVFNNNNVTIVSSKKDEIRILRTVYSVNNVTIEDSACTGQPVLKITQEDDALPLIFDDNFEIANSRLNFTQPETLPVCLESQSIVNQLRNKLIEARYTTKCNENTYKEYVKLRQVAAFSMYQKTCADTWDSSVNLNLKQISSALKVNIKVPIVKLCNKKIVVILKVHNKNSEPMTNVHVLLHGSSLPSIVYTTKLFKSRLNYFKETDSQIKSNFESIVIATIDLKELKYSITSRVDFDVVLSYKLNDKFYLLPFESVSISALDAMGTNFDVLASEKDYAKTLLAILATSNKVDLKLRHMQTSDEQTITFPRLFHEYLNMKGHLDYENIAIHNESPFHTLHGVMVHHVTSLHHVMSIEVYTRDPSQALALIHYMQDKVPHKIIVTTPEVEIKPIDSVRDEFINYYECDSMLQVDYRNYVLAIIKQIKVIKKYLFDCIKKMNEEGKIDDNRINYIALGIPKYLEFRQQVLRGLQVLPVPSD